MLNKLILLFILNLFVGHFASANSQNCPSFIDAVGSTCNPLAPYARSGRTTFWGQEYSGVDLVRDEMRLIVGAELVDVAVFDLGFEKAHVTLTESIDVPPQLNGNRKMTAHHGTAMVNLINGPSPYGATDKARIMGLHSIPSAYSYFSVIEKFKKQGRLPKIISNSLGWSGPIVAETVSTAYDLGVFWFLAAGNDFPEPVRDYEVSSRAMLVGSFSPFGWTSYETQNHSDLLVLAPTDESIATIDGKGMHSSIGQSSGGTALTAAAAVNILSLLPNLNHQLFKILIQKTAFDSIENKIGFSKNPKLLNAYKAFKVAERVRAQCANLDLDCIGKYLNLVSTYEFTASDVKCDEVLVASAENQKKLFVQLRKNALLGVRGQPQELACVYRKLGFVENAHYFQFIISNKVAVKDLELIARQEITNGTKIHPLFRFMNLYDASIEDLIHSQSKFSDYDKKQLLNLRSIKHD